MNWLNLDITMHYHPKLYASFLARVMGPKLPARIGIFLWKVAMNCLPTKTRLIERHVPIDDLCSLCGEGMENSYHALVSCSFALDVWNEFYGNGWPANIMNISDWWSWVIQQNTEKIEETSCLLWVVWARRNN